MPMCAPIPAQTPPDPQRPQLLGQLAVVQVAAGTPAVLDPELELEQPKLGHALEHLVGEPLGGLPFRHVA